MSSLFKADELRQKLLPTWEKLYGQDPESIPFRQPMDLKPLAIHSQEVNRIPMDLSTIKRKLDTGEYCEPWDYVHDVELMFDNARLCNKKSTRLYRYCTKLSEVFEHEINPVMQSMGFCCGGKYTFKPRILSCYGKQLCTIAVNKKYYSYENRYKFCQTCFNDIQGDTVQVGDDDNPTMINKDEFKEIKNDCIELEKFVTCDCGRKLHKICVLHNENVWPTGYTCDHCHKKKGTKRKENKFTAKLLPNTNLGTFIENHVNNFLIEKEAGAGKVHIRVAFSSEKTVVVKPGMRSRFVETGEMPAEFPYRAKALFAFEEIDGVDVCFFGMHVQEYGSDCPPPNTRRVYIAYLDSVPFFKPPQFRTSVYHEILLAYMNFVKKSGFTMAHIWSCPPQQGVEYIFRSHPEGQKIPTATQLKNWYKKMLDKGITDGVVCHYQDILKQATEDNLQTAAEMPYFEGDFWPDELEQRIKKQDQGKGKKRKSKASKRKKSESPHTDNDLSTEIFDKMAENKEMFFVVRLHSVESAASLGPTLHCEPNLECYLMDGRETFLTLAREKHYEFSSLRRAKYITMWMLYSLHKGDKYQHTCNNCRAHVETRYHCTVCDDFDLCVHCYENGGHCHKMAKDGMVVDDGTALIYGDAEDHNSAAKHGNLMRQDDLNSMATTSANTTDRPFSNDEDTIASPVLKRPRIGRKQAFPSKEKQVERRELSTALIYGDAEDHNSAAKHGNLMSKDDLNSMASTSANTTDRPFSNDEDSIASRVLKRPRLVRKRLYPSKEKQVERRESSTALIYGDAEDHNSAAKHGNLMSQDDLNSMASTSANTTDRPFSNDEDTIASPVLRRPRIGRKQAFPSKENQVERRELNTALTHVCAGDHNYAAKRRYMMMTTNANAMDSSSSSDEDTIASPVLKRPRIV